MAQKKQNRHSIVLTDNQLELEKKVLAAHGYPSPTAAYVSFLRHCALTQAEHSITGDWTGLPGDDQDEIDEGILDLIASGERLRGSWVKALIYECIKELNGADAQRPRVLEVEGKLSDAARKVLVKRVRP